MNPRHLPVLHPAGLAVGAALAGFGILLAETFLGPLLARNLTDPQERMMGMVHQKLVEDYINPPTPLEGPWRAQLMRRAIQGMMESLEDPYSAFVGPSDLRLLDEESNGVMSGIGLVLNADGRVRYPRPGGPAERAGILPGDRILSLNGRDVTRLSLDELVHSIKGPLGTTLDLVIQHADQSLATTQVVRARIPTYTVRRIQILDDSLGIGSFHITSFASSTPGEVDRALEQLLANHLKGLILDLRFNPGGSLDAAVEVASRFLRGGVVTTLEKRGDPPEVHRADPRFAREDRLPLVVLLNGYSASGSEVLAGALRDRGAAVLVGSRSFGKGVFQEVYRFPTGKFAVKIAAGYYLTPAGHNLEAHLDPDRAGGLEPDIPVHLSPQDSARLRNSLDYEDPPPKYRDQVFRIFPEVARYKRPSDPAMKTALSLLKAVLAPV